MTRRARRSRSGWSPIQETEESTEVVEPEAEAPADEPDIEPQRMSLLRRPSDDEQAIPGPPRRPRLTRSRGLRLLSAALLVAGVAFLSLGVVRPWMARSASYSYTTSTVTMGDVTASSVATGSVAPSTVYGLEFGSAAGIVSTTATTSGSGGSVSDTSGSTANSGASSLGWPVKTVSVVEGQKVKQGDVLATADSSAAQLALLSAKADLASAQARLDADQASGRASTATTLIDEAQLAKAQAARDAAESAVAHASIVAPADGLVTAVDVLAGVTAPSGYAIQMSSGAMVATASFAESDVSNLAVGQAASVSVTALDATVNGVVASIAPAADSSSAVSGGVVSYAVRVTLTDPPASLRAGMSATITITTDSATSVLRVPATAIAGSSSSGYTVRVVADDGSVSSEDVGIGLVTSSYVEITRGLALNQTVVTGTSASRNGSTTTSAGGFPVGIPGGFGR